MSEERFTFSYASKRPKEQHVSITRNVTDNSATSATTPKTPLQAFLPCTALKAGTPTIDGYPVSAFLPHATWACNGNPAAFTTGASRRTLLGLRQESAPQKPTFKKVTINCALDGKSKDVVLVDPNADNIKEYVKTRAELAKKGTPKAREERVIRIINILDVKYDSPDETELNPGSYGRISYVTREELRKKEYDEMQEGQKEANAAIARIKAEREARNNTLILAATLSTVSAIVAVALFVNARRANLLSRNEIFR